VGKRRNPEGARTAVEVMAPSNYDESVFINCPFDEAYFDTFRAIQFTVLDCGFRVRSALEEIDSSVVRIEKIYNIIRQCRFGIHDISRTELDEDHTLPRFNMPLELGVFLGAKRFGQREQKQKVCLILDIDRYRYQKYISDIAGQDIRAHKGSAREAVKVVRDWLSFASDTKVLPDAKVIWNKFRAFESELPDTCDELRLDHNHLNYNDYLKILTRWLSANAGP
jgi:hypothetical protein